MPDQSDEEDLRRLQCEIEGVDASPVLKFLGESYEIRMGGGLVAILRFAALASAKREEDEKAGGGFRELIATHKFLGECIEPDDWPWFQEAAINGKASEEEVGDIARRAIEILTARPAHAGMRLLAWAAANLGELDGQLLRGTGTALASLTARQLCNIIFSARLEGLEEAERTEFIQDLNAEVTAQQKALDQALEHIKGLQEQRDADAAAAEKKTDMEPVTEEPVMTPAEYIARLGGDSGGEFTMSMDDE